MGDRNGRWAMIIEKDGTVSYAENEASPKDVEVSLVYCLGRGMIGD
jgi:alkyl hydroperoxide reductase 1